MIQFVDPPKVIGTYRDLRPRYDVEVPLKGEPLASCIFSGLTVSEAVAEMNARANRFNQEEISQKYTPSTWINVGYYLEPPTIEIPAEPHTHLESATQGPQTVSNPDFGKIVVYYQVRTGFFVEPPS